MRDLWRRRPRPPDGHVLTGWRIPPGGHSERSPLSSEPKTIARGKALYAANCARCHGPEGKGDGPGSGYAADFTDNLRIELNTEGVLFYKIWNGRVSYGKGPREDMPAFQGKLEKDQVWTVVEYLKICEQPVRKRLHYITPTLRSTRPLPFPVSRGRTGGVEGQPQRVPFSTGPLWLPPLGQERATRDALGSGGPKVTAVPKLDALRWLRRLRYLTGPGYLSSQFSVSLIQLRSRNVVTRLVDHAALVFGRRPEEPEHRCLTALGRGRRSRRGRSA